VGPDGASAARFVTVFCLIVHIIGMIGFLWQTKKIEEGILRLLR